MTNWRLLFLLLFYLTSQITQGQIVVTVAGQPEVSGTDDGPAFEATFNNPHGIAVDQEGNVYTADRWSHLIRKISLDGTVTTLAGQANIAGDTDGDSSVALFNEPWGICVDPQGNILVADTRNNKIRKVTPSGMVSTIAGSGNFGSADGVGTSSTFGNPTGIEADAFGNIYVADHLTHIIRKIDPNGVVSTIAGQPYQTGSLDGPGGIASFNRPYGLTLDNEGNILVADEWNHKIRKITPDGVVSTFAGDGQLGSDDGLANTVSFNFPWDIAVDSSGNVFVADGYNYVIRKIFTDQSVLTFVGSLETTGAVDGTGTQASFSGATALAISPLTKEIFVGDAYNNLVRKIIDLNQGVSLLYANGSDNTLCLGEELVLNASPDVYDNYFFYVNGQITQSSSDYEFKISSLPAGTHQIQVVVQDNGNTFQSSPRTITVFEPPQPEITVVGNTTFFEGDSTILIASQAESYIWSNGQMEPTITVFASGEYFVEVADTNGCFGTSPSVFVEVTPNAVAPTITAEGPTELCFGETVVLNSSQANQIQWLKDGWPIPDATSANLTVNESGIYQIQSISAGGQTVVSEPLEVTQIPPFDLDFVTSQTTAVPNFEITFQLTPSNLSNISWDFGVDGMQAINEDAIQPVVSYPEAGVYTVGVSAEDEFGCRDTINKNNHITILEVEDGELLGNDLFIPNAFTPNDDGENDVLFIRGANITNVLFNVYNHWGELLFESNDQADGWDGRVEGEMVQNGTYVYCATIELADGTTKQVAGKVTVIK